MVRMRGCVLRAHRSMVSARTFQKRNRHLRSQTVRRLIGLVSILPGLTLLATVAASPSPAGAATTTYTGSLLGLDTCRDPTVSQMQAFWTNTPYFFWGIYIGGSNMGCSQPNLNSSWISSVTNGNQFWALTPFWVGAQMPVNSCGTRSYRSYISLNTTTAYNQGQTEGTSAFNEILGLGMGSNTPITYDLEGFSHYTNATCTAAAQAFVNGWTHQLAVAPPQDSGVYGSTCQSDLDKYAFISRPPTYIHGASWDNNSSTAVMPCVSSGHWVDNQRLKQYQGGHNVTENGVTLNVDSDSVDGPVYVYPPQSS
jgi:Domain of unknown function (DUF1906)